MVRLCAMRFLSVVACSCLLYFAFYHQCFPRLSHNYAVKQLAVNKAAAAQEVIGAILIGPEYTEITTTLGPASVKKLALHPDFAAVAVELLERAGIREGDRVAVNFSGSFPALNIAVLAALDAIKAQPVITSSVGASTWGATDPEFTWVDMEKALAESGLWHWRSRGVAVGGVSDSGKGLQPEGVAKAQAAIARAGLPLLTSENLQQAIDRRLEIYRGNGNLPAALVNVGGSHVAFGAEGHKNRLREGLSIGYRPSFALSDGLGLAFVESNRPVINFLNIAMLAGEFGIREDTPVLSSAVFYERSLPTGVRMLLVASITAIIGVLWHGRKKGWWQGPCR